MNRILQWNTLQEAADYLSGELGENWTPRQVLDAGEQQSFKVRFILPHDVKALAGRMEEWVGDKPELMPVCINGLLNDGRVLVGFVPFIEHATKRETVLELKPRPIISFDEIRISGSELEDFAASERTAAKGKAGAGTTLAPAAKAGTNKKKWDDVMLRTLWEESIMPGVTQTSLAKKHGVKRQRIAVLLETAKGKFSTMRTHSGMKNTYGQIIK